MTLKLILSLVSRGLGALQCNFGRYRCAAEIAKTPSVGNHRSPTRQRRVEILGDE